MRTELKAKFIQHLNRKQSEKGFTLVELLVVIIIIGILAAIALPNFLNQGAKAKQTEAKQNIGMTNRVQTVYRSENNAFADTFDKLAMGVLSGASTTASTSNYDYVLIPATDTSTLTAQAKDTALKSYSGGSFLYLNSETKNVIASIACEAITPGNTLLVGPSAPVTPNDLPTCDAAGVKLGS
jgi:type IV pilus assembly protein PilA